MGAVGEAFERFVEVVRRLRDPNGGCPWDLEQDHRSLRPYLIEESYEVLDAIDAGDDSEIAKELGDVLLQVVLHAQIATDRSAFGIETVITSVCEKMIRRHPHVFGSVKVNDADEVVRNWERIKSEERGTPDAPAEASATLQGIPKALPALIRAQRLGEKAAKVSFDWQNASDVREKLTEELGELDAELTASNALTSPEKMTEAQKTRVTEEMGDVLFSLCQLARWLGFHAEDALRGCSDRFVARFEEMERALGRPLAGLTEDEMEEAWEQAKRSV